MNDFIEKNNLDVPEWVLNPEMVAPEEIIPEETDDPDSLIQELI